MIRFRSTLLALLAAAGFLLAAGPVAAQVNLTFGDSYGDATEIQVAQQNPRKGGAACLSEQEIARAIASGQIRSWAAIRTLAGIPPAYYETSDVQVCMRNGAPYYVVNMVSPKGENVKFVLNAQDGSS